MYSPGLKSTAVLAGTVRDSCPLFRSSDFSLPYGTGRERILQLH